MIRYLVFNMCKIVKSFSYFYKFIIEMIRCKYIVTLNKLVFLKSTEITFLHFWALLTSHDTNIPIKIVCVCTTSRSLNI